MNTATRAEAMTFLKKWCDLFQITDSPVSTALVPRPEPVAPLPDRALTTRPSSLSQTQTGGVFTLHPGVVTGNTLREFSNEFALEYGKVFLDWFHDLTLRDKEWKKITPHNISDLVFNFVGVPRAEGQLVEEFIAENNWQELEDKEDIIYVLTSLLPAEYLVHVHFQSGKCTLKSRLHRILLRLCMVNQFPVDFKLQPLAVSSRLLFKSRHLCELSSTRQVRLFRVLSELYFHGTSIAFLCSVYGVNKQALHELIDWVLGNITVSESRVCSAFFDMRAEVDRAQTKRLDVQFQQTGDQYLTPIWLLEDDLFEYLQNCVHEIQDAELPVHNKDLLIGNFSQQKKADVFIVMFLSVNLIEDATAKLDHSLKDWGELWAHYEALRSVLSPALRAVLDAARPIFAGAFEDAHPLSDDCVVLAQNWVKLKMMPVYTGEIQEAILICDRLVESGMRSTSESLIFCVIESRGVNYVPGPLRLLEL